MKKILQALIFESSVFFCNTLYKLLFKIKANVVNSYLIEWHYKNQSSFLSNQDDFHCVQQSLVRMVCTLVHVHWAARLYSTSKLLQLSQSDRDYRGGHSIATIGETHLFWLLFPPHYHSKIMIKHTFNSSLWKIRIFSWNDVVKWINICSWCSFTWNNAHLQSVGTKLTPCSSVQYSFTTMNNVPVSCSRNWYKLAVLTLYLIFNYHLFKKDKMNWQSVFIWYVVVRW